MLSRVLEFPASAKLFLTKNGDPKLGDNYEEYCTEVPIINMNYLKTSVIFRAVLLKHQYFFELNPLY